MAHIGKSISIHGELTGDEDLTIEGKVEGKVTLPNNHLTIGQSGDVRADVQAELVTVVGRVTGDVSATERIEVEATGIVEGDVRAPRLVVQEGASLNGAIEMSTAPKAAQAASAPKPIATGKPAATASP